MSLLTENVLTTKPCPTNKLSAENCCHRWPRRNGVYKNGFGTVRSNGQCEISRYSNWKWNGRKFCWRYGSQSQHRMKRIPLTLRFLFVCSSISVISGVKWVWSTVGACVVWLFGSEMAGLCKLIDLLTFSCCRGKYSTMASIVDCALLAHSTVYLHQLTCGFIRPVYMSVVDIAQFV